MFGSFVITRQTPRGNANARAAADDNLRCWMLIPSDVGRGLRRPCCGKGEVVALEAVVYVGGEEGGTVDAGGEGGAEIEVGVLVPCVVLFAYLDSVDPELDFAQLAVGVCSGVKRGGGSADGPSRAHVEALAAPRIPAGAEPA